MRASRTAIGHFLFILPQPSCHPLSPGNTGKHSSHTPMPISLSLPRAEELLSFLIITLRMFKPHNLSKWPTPPCELYHPTDVLYDSVCPDVTAHVCATNGHTYQNECFFCLDQWEFGPHIQFNRYGRCE
uniref:Kazal-like domain-containing protein n=1 Tax=Equus caballus TaxID=9796 RepID=A0A9L0TM34_HORSE